MVADNDGSDCDATRATSALQENIQKKGKNAYYYAHGPKIDGPTWDGNEEPRLLASASPNPSSSSDRTVTFASFESFAWVDGTKNVKIYVDFDRADELDDADIILINSSNSIEFSVCRDQKHFKLILDSLSESIVSATVKKKSDKFILSLVKEAETSWFELRKAKK